MSHPLIWSFTGWPNYLYCYLHCNFLTLRCFQTFPLHSCSTFPTPSAPSQQRGPNLPPPINKPNLHFRSAAQPPAWATVQPPFHDGRWRIPHRPPQTHLATSQGRSLPSIDQHWSKTFRFRRKPTVQGTALLISHSYIFLCKRKNSLSPIPWNSVESNRTFI